MKIGDCLDVKYGKDYKHLNEGQYPLLGTGGVMEYVDDFLYSGESILIGRKGTIDKPKYINDPFWTVDTLFYTEIKKQFPKFLFYCISNINWLKYNEASGVPSLSANNIKSVKINVPSLNEQKKIANFITSIDYKIELLEKKYESYVNFKKYLMQQIFAQKLRFDFDDEWKNIPFKKILKEINEKTTVNNQHEILSSTKEGIFTQKEYFADRNVASKDNTGYKILRKNQIVLSPQNLWMGNINVNTEFDIGIVSPSYKIYETTDLVDINYFKHVIKLPRLIYEYTCASEQGASIVRRNLNKQLFNEITIKVPSHDEQKKIGNLLDVCDEKIKNIDKNIKDMKEFKKGLLQQMFDIMLNVNLFKWFIL